MMNNLEIWYYRLTEMYYVVRLESGLVDECSNEIRTEREARTIYNRGEIADHWETERDFLNQQADWDEIEVVA